MLSISVNYDRLKDKVVEASLAAFQEVSEHLRGDEIGAMCLYTDDGAMRANVAFASKSYLQKVDDSFDWSLWPFLGVGETHFNEICDILANIVLSSGEPKAALLVHVMSTFVTAAVEIRDQIAPNNASFIMLVDTEATVDVLEGQEKRIERLNSPEVFQQFLEWQSSRSAYSERPQ